MDADVQHGVVIADDDEKIRTALEGLLGDHPGLCVLGLATDGVGAADLCRRHQPSVAVVDVRMPNGDTTAVDSIRDASPDTVIVIYTALADRRTRERLLGAGAAAVVVKGSGSDLPAVLYELADSPRQRSESASLSPHEDRTNAFDPPTPGATP